MPSKFPPNLRAVTLMRPGNHDKAEAALLAKILSYHRRNVGDALLIDV
jgi:hypothetical protein